MNKMLLALVAVSALLLSACSSSPTEENSDSSGYTVVLPKISVNEVDPAIYNKTYAVYLTVIHYPQDTLYKQLLAFNKHEVNIPVKVASGSKIQFSIMGLDSSENPTWYGNSEWVAVSGDTAVIDLKTSLTIFGMTQDIPEAKNIYQDWLYKEKMVPSSNQYQELEVSYYYWFYADGTYSVKAWNVALRTTGRDTIFYGEEIGRFAFKDKVSEKLGTIQMTPDSIVECADLTDMNVNYCGKQVAEARMMERKMDTTLTALYELHADSMTLTIGTYAMQLKTMGTLTPQAYIATDLRNMDTIPYISIHNKKWMTKDLNFASSDYPSWCYGDSTSCPSGRLYNWNSAKNLCPTGWHLPTSLEWVEFLMIAGGTSQLKTAGKRLLDADFDGTDNFGFHARLGGYKGGNTGKYVEQGNYGLYWTSTGDPSADTSAYIIYFSSPSETPAAGISYLPTTSSASVRCVQDES